MGKKLSIVVPVYNVENYLDKCLDSILRQTLTDLEIICVNDGSTDGSGEILRDYAKKDSRIIVIEQENRGLGAARNAGIERAVGEYIGFVDSDDFVDQTMFEKLYEKAVKYNADIVLTNVKLYYTDTGATEIFRDEDFYGNMSDTGFFTVMQHPRILRFIGVWDRIYRREFLNAHKLLNPVNRIYEDVLFTVQSCVYAKRISVVNEPLYYYRKNTGRSIVDRERDNDGFKQDFLKNLRESREFLLQCGKWTDLRKEFLAFQFQMILHHQYNSGSRKSFVAFMRGVSEILPQEDIQVIADQADVRAMRIYVSLLQKKRFARAYIMFKGKKLYNADEFYLYVRLPKTKRYWKIRKPGYRWKREMMAQKDLTGEVRQLRQAIEAANLAKERIS